MNYTIEHRGAKFAGLDWYCCDQCTYKTPSSTGILVHIEMMHPQKKEYTVKELQAIAKENDLAIRGTKAELLERLEGIV